MSHRGFEVQSKPRRLFWQYLNILVFWIDSMHTNNLQLHNNANV